MDTLVGLVKKSRRVVTETYPDARIKDIVDTILYADQRGSAFTARLAPHLSAKNDYETLRNIWKFTRKHIRYRRDRAGRELVKSPGATIQDGYADCKSMSVFIGSILRNLGFDYFYRVARYDPATPEQGHIYPIVVLPGGKKVVVDAVNNRFDQEYEYWRKQDYSPRAALPASAVSGSEGDAAVPPKSNTAVWIALFALGIWAAQNRHQI